MADDSGSGWQSFNDYLGMTEESLRELEAQAQERAQASDAEAQEALTRTYRQARGDVEAGGQGQLSGQTSYLDFVKAQREAQQYRAGDPSMMSAQEAAARGLVRQGMPQAEAPDYTVRMGQMDSSLSGYRQQWQAAETVRKANEARAKAEADARAEAEARARKKAIEQQTRATQYTKYADAVNKDANLRGGIGAGATYDGYPR